MVDLNGTAESRAALVYWLRQRHPNLYQQVLREAGVNLGTLSDTIGKIFGTIKDTVLQLGPAYIQTKNEIELLKLNIARAKQGLNPVNALPSNVVPAGGDTGGAAYDSGSGMPGWLIPVGVAVLAVILLRR